jgi:hypothetical protein
MIVVKVEVGFGKGLDIAVLVSNSARSAETSSSVSIPSLTESACNTNR